MFELSDFYDQCKQNNVDIIPFLGCPNHAATVRDDEWLAVFLDFDQIRSTRLLRGICYHESDMWAQEHCTKYPALLKLWDAPKPKQTVGPPSIT